MHTPKAPVNNACLTKSIEAIVKQREPRYGSTLLVRKASDTFPLGWLQVLFTIFLFEFYYKGTRS